MEGGWGGSGTLGVAGAAAFLLAPGSGCLVGCYARALVVATLLQRVHSSAMAANARGCILANFGARYHGLVIFVLVSR